MMIRLCAYIDRDQSIYWGTGFGLASGDQVWSRTTNCILDDICYEAGKNDTESISFVCELAGTIPTLSEVPIW